jgi:hypothetical protein
MSLNRERNTREARDPFQQSEKSEQNMVKTPHPMAIHWDARGINLDSNESKTH